MKLSGKTRIAENCRTTEKADKEGKSRNYREQLELEEYDSPEPGSAEQEKGNEGSSSEGTSARDSSAEEKDDESSGEGQDDGDKEQDSNSNTDTVDNGPDQQQVRYKRPMRPGQQKWYDSLNKPTIYRPPEEREKKPKPEPQQRSTDHLRPEYLNYAEVILALFILAVVSAVVWVSAEYLLAEAVLSSPLGWLEATGWISRMSVYVLVGFGAGFGVSLWRYKRRRQALIDHLTGRTKR